MTGEPAEAKRIQLKNLEILGDTDLLSSIAEKTWNNRGALDDPEAVAGVVSDVLRLRGRQTSEWRGSRFAGEIQTLLDHVTDMTSLNAGAVPEYAKELNLTMSVRKKTATTLGHNIPFDKVDQVRAGVEKEMLRTGARAGDRSRR
jgi:hypothetical protein